MRERQDWLPKLVIAECLTNTGKYMPIIEYILHQLTHQRCWTLAAHDKNYQNFYGKQYDVDLSASTLALTMSQTQYLLGEKLSKKTQNEIKDALKKRIFDPVIQTFKTKKGHWWLTATSNWNPVCISGVCGAALSTLTSKYDRAVFAYIAERYGTNYLISFTNDGYCSEGLGYYNYGFGRYLLLRECLLLSTNNKLDLFESNKMKNIALFPINLEIINNCYPTIADCRMGAKPDAGILWYCNHAFQLGLKKYDSVARNNMADLGFDLIKLFNKSVSKVKDASLQSDNDKYNVRSYFENAGLLICRPDSNSISSAIGVAIKGGNNNEIHNHNDVGSYTIVLGKEVFMGDPGGPNVYNSKTFSSARYTFFKTFASFGHPVPVVAGTQQQEGSIARARVINTNFSNEKDALVMDISSAYPVPSLLTLDRSFAYYRNKSGKLQVADTFSFSSPQLFETAIITRAKWKQINENQLELQGEKGTLLVTIKAPCSFKIVSEDINEDQPTFTRIGICLNEKLMSGSVCIEYKVKEIQ